VHEDADQRDAGLRAGQGGGEVVLVSAEARRVAVVRLAWPLFNVEATQTSLCIMIALGLSMMMNMVKYAKRL
jgi:hypothetical protein